MPGSALHSLVIDECMLFRQKGTATLRIVRLEMDLFLEEKYFWYRVMFARTVMVGVIEVRVKF